MSNSSRIIQGLVSLEAWHKQLELDAKSPFHIAVSFSDARYSGSSESPIEFRVRLKRATLVVICDEGLNVPKATKVRQFPPRVRSVTTKQGGEQSNTAEAEIRAKLAAASDGKASAEVEGKNKSARTIKATGESQVAENITQTIHMTYRDEGEEHHWDCRPIHEDSLIGPAHDGLDPIMEILPKVDKRLADLGARVFIKCAADDFDIDEITIKPSFKERIWKTDEKRRKKLAREIIKEMLAEAQLDVVSLEPRFQEVIFADIRAIPE